MAQQKKPAPKQQATPNTVAAVLAYSRRFLIYGFAISVALHLIFGPFVNWKPPAQGEKEKIEKVSVTKVQTPRPTSTPTPPPSPTPTPQTQTAPPQTQPPQRLKVNVVKTTSKSEGGPSEAAYNVKSGSEQGVPQGLATTGPPAVVAAAPTPTKAACANPNMPATATQKVTPDMPEIARQMGASGTAQVKVTLDADGHVTGTAIYASTHNKALDNAALQAAQQSKYAPEIDNCVKTGGSYLYTVTFESQ